MYKFRHFRSRLLFFLLSILLPVLAGSYYFVSRTNTQYTEQTINSYLQLGAEVFDFTRAQQAETLQAITNSLTWDFGFRTAFASGDPATLLDAAFNVLDRSLASADMLMIVDMDNRVVVDTEAQGFAELQGQWLQLIESADTDPDGFAASIVAIRGLPFQLIVLPLYLPRQVAWIVGGFALDDAFVELVSDSIVSEVSILRRTRDDGAEILASTLPSDQQRLLLTQLSTDSLDQQGLQRVDLASGEYTSLLRPLLQSESLEVAAVIQRSYDENDENLEQFRALLLEFYLLVIAVSLLAVYWLARTITRPVASLAETVKHIDRGDYSRRAQVASRDELGALASSVNSMSAGLAEKEKVRDLLGKVVSQQIAEELLSNPVELGGEERIVTVLFSDIRGFTSYCEGKSPAQVLESLNAVLSTISDIVERHHGVVDKFLGDAVMALFGAPVQSPGDAHNAMAATRDIIEALSDLHGDLSACVGVNTGRVVAGNLGSQNRLNYSVIGDPVNLAARLESLTRLYNVDNIVSHSSMTKAPGFEFFELDSVRVAGKNQPVTIYQLVSSQRMQRLIASGCCDSYAAGLAAYRTGDWQQSLECFGRYRAACDNTALADLFIGRLQAFMQEPPGPEWDGVYVFNKK